jgi:hypothetical protein
MPTGGSDRAPDSTRHGRTFTGRTTDFIEAGRLEPSIPPVASMTPSDMPTSHGRRAEVVGAYPDAGERGEEGEDCSDRLD